MLTAPAPGASLKARHITTEMAAVFIETFNGPAKTQSVLSIGNADGFRGNLMFYNNRFPIVLAVVLSTNWFGHATGGVIG
jgi:hypothetical protein